MLTNLKFSNKKHFHLFKIFNSKAAFRTFFYIALLISMLDRGNKLICGNPTMYSNSGKC
jgi:hypothetical protein